MPASSWGEGASPAAAAARAAIAPAARRRKDLRDSDIILHLRTHYQDWHYRERWRCKRVDDGVLERMPSVCGATRITELIICGFEHHPLNSNLEMEVPLKA
jgi:hypothetical protein